MADTDTVIEEEVLETEEAVVTDTDATQTEETESKDTKVLLSDDGDEGADDVDPSTYEYTPPEGEDLSEEAQSRIDAFKHSAASLKLTPEQFQGVVDAELERGREAVGKMAGQYQERIRAWGDEVRADPELGGEKLEANLAVIKSVTGAYGDPALMSLMGAPSEENPEGLGLGNHPAVLRFLHRIGTSLADDNLIEGDGHKAANADGLQRMYPSMFPNA